MSPINSYLQELGFRADDGMVAVHADDLGICLAAPPTIDELTACDETGSLRADGG
jgi:hypothetical protein